MKVKLLVLAISTYLFYSTPLRFRRQRWSVFEGVLRQRKCLGSWSIATELATAAVAGSCQAVLKMFRIQSPFSKREPCTVPPKTAILGYQDISFWVSFNVVMFFLGTSIRWVALGAVWTWVQVSPLSFLSHGALEKILNFLEASLSFLICKWRYPRHMLL